MKIIADNEENLMENLLLWRDALLNFIHFNNHDFHLFLTITLIDFLVPKLSVQKIFDKSSFFIRIFCSLLIKLMIQIPIVVQWRILYLNKILI